MSAAVSQTSFESAGLVGTVHYFGEHGLAYEVMAIEDQERVLVRLVESDETLSYPVANVRTDPDA